MNTCRMVQRIPATVRLEDAIFCAQCSNITESKFSVERCHYCQSKAIVRLEDWLNRPAGSELIEVLEPGSFEN